MGLVYMAAAPALNALLCLVGSAPLSNVVPQLNDELAESQFPGCGGAEGLRRELLKVEAADREARQSKRVQVLHRMLSFAFSILANSPDLRFAKGSIPAACVSASRCRAALPNFSTYAADTQTSL